MNYLKKNTFVEKVLRKFKISDFNKPNIKLRTEAVPKKIIFPSITKFK